MPEIGVLVVSAGSGLRMGGDLPKPYLPLGGIPILIRTLRAFERWGAFLEGRVVVSPDRTTWVSQELFPQWEVPKRWRVVSGGASRAASVSKGLAAISKRCEWVFVHDAVRPFLTRELLCTLVAQVSRGENCIVALPAKDTLKQVKGTRIERTLSRESVWLAQTPQVFSCEVLRRAFEKLGPAALEATDDAALAERIEVPVSVVAGDARNIKITTPLDLALAEAILQTWEET